MFGRNNYDYLQMQITIILGILPVDDLLCTYKRHVELGSD